MCRLLEPLHGSLPITSAILTALKKKLDNFPCIQLPTTTPLRFFIFLGISTYISCHLLYWPQTQIALPHGVKIFLVNLVYSFF